MPYYSCSCCLSGPQPLVRRGQLCLRLVLTAASCDVACSLNPACSLDGPPVGVGTVTSVAIAGVAAAIAVAKVKVEGLAWGEAHKLVPVAFGVKKLVLSCVVEDDKVRMPVCCFLKHRRVLLILLTRKMWLLMFCACVTSRAAGGTTQSTLICYCCGCLPCIAAT